jgi:hypothetical protein
MVRFANALLCLALLVTTAALVEGGVRRALIGAWIVGVVPLGLFTVASVSNSSWTTTGVGIAWAAALGAAEARSRRRALALVAITVVCVALAIGSRGDGAAFALVSVALGLAVSDRVRHALARRLWPLVGIGALAVAAVAGLTAAMARVQFGYVFDPVVYFFANAWSQPDLLLPNLVEIPQLWAGAFGSWGVSWGIGAGDVPLPAVVGVLMLLSVGFLVSAGLQAMWRAKGVALLILAALLWFVPLVFLQNVGVQVGEWVQPRYLLPLILVGLGLALTTHARAALTVNRTQWLVLAATVSIAQAVALHRLIRRYVTGVDVTSWNLDRSVEWWWSWLPPPMIIWALGSIAFAALAFLGLRVALHPAGTRAESP